MTVSRIAFALDDLEDEVRALCVGVEPKIIVMLGSLSFDRVVAALADHAGLPAPACDLMAHNGIVIARIKEPAKVEDSDARPPAAA